MCIGNSKKGLFHYKSKPTLEKALEGQISVPNLWHYRLGHPSFKVLKEMTPDLKLNKIDPRFQFCKCCPLGKLQQLPFNKL